VIEAGNGFEGLTKAREQHPDVIVLDLGLPGLSGMDVLVQLRRDRQLAAVPVAITTADPEPEARCGRSAAAPTCGSPTRPTRWLR